MNQHVPIIFIVGSSRSGTTMFNRVLGNHSKILGLNELHYIGRNWDMQSSERWSLATAREKAASLLATARRSLWDETPFSEEVEEAAVLFPDSPQLSDEYAPKEVLSRVLDYLAAESGKTMATDQTPRNVLYLGAILENFPQAKVIFMVRDPRAVLYSQKNRWKQRGLGATHTPWLNALRVFANYHPFTSCKLWLAAYNQGQAHLHDSRVYMLQFERLVQDPTAEVKRVCQFLELEFEPGMLDVPQVGSSNAAHREDVKGVSADVANSWLGRLSSAETWICQKIAGSEMTTLGYEPVPLQNVWGGLLLQALLYPLHAIGVVIMNPRLALRVFRVIRKAS